MITASAALKAHLAGEYLTVATLWKVTREDGEVFRFTDHDQDILYSGATWAASTGYLPSAVQTSSDLAVDNLEVQGVLDSAAITDADIAAGLWDYAEVEIVIVNWADLTMGQLIVRRGRLGEVTTGKLMFVAELRGMAQNLQQEFGRLIMPGCNADLGDARCGVNLASFTSTFTLTSVVSGRSFTDSALAGATGLFTYGKVTFTSGQNNGLEMEVKNFTSGGIIELQQPMPYVVAVGDTGTISQGCDKSTGASGCTKFSNIINFRGYPHLPGMDRLISGK